MQKMIGTTGVAAIAIGLVVVAAPSAVAAKGTVGVPGCSLTYDTGWATVSPSGQVSYTGPSFSADTSSCVPETPPDRG